MRKRGTRGVHWWIKVGTDMRYGNHSIKYTIGKRSDKGCELVHRHEVRKLPVESTHSVGEVTRGVEKRIKVYMQVHQVCMQVHYQVYNDHKVWLGGHKHAIYKPKKAICGP